MLAQSGHALALRQVLAHEPVGVLVTASLPRVVRPREVERRTRQPLDPPVVVELRPVVGRHRLERPGVPADEPGDSPAQRPGRPISAAEVPDSSHHKRKN